MTLPSTFLDQSLASLQATTMYQLVRKETKKPTKQLVRDNWPRMTLGLCSGYYFYQWAKDLREVQPSFALAYDIVLHPSEITPDKLTHRYHHVILAMVMYATVAFSRQFLQHGSNLVLAFRPGSTSNINNGNLLPLPQQQRQPEKEQDQEQQRKQADQTEAAALVSGSSSWASMFFPSALKHATWMYHYNFYDALISATDMILKRYHAYLPDLWPKAWNSTVGKQTMDQFLIYLDQYRTTETAYETFLATGWVILFPALLGWTLRAFIMDLQNEPRTWWGGRVDPNRWTVVERMTATLVKNRRVQELKRIVGQGFKMMGSWLALNWPKLSLMGLSIRSLVKIDYLRQSIQSLVITTVQQSRTIIAPEDRRALLYPLMGFTVVAIGAGWVISFEFISNLVLSLRLPFRLNYSRAYNIDNADQTKEQDKSSKSLISHVQLMYRYTMIFYPVVGIFRHLDVLGHSFKWIERNARSPQARYLAHFADKNQQLGRQATAERLASSSWPDYLKFYSMGSYGTAIFSWWTLRTLLKDLRSEPRTWWGGEL